MMDAMKKALDAKIGKGFIIEISVKPDEQKEMEMAPEVEIESPEVHDEEVKKALVGGIEEADKEDMLNRKPRSLMERMKQKALKE